MAAFFEDLWTSVFTPGPTSTLLIATNVTFAGLQTILLALLIATYSVHFVVLSVLSAGLWLAINWFAKEVMIAQAEQDEHKRRAGGVTDGSTEGPSLGMAATSAAANENTSIDAVELPAESILQPDHSRSRKITEGDSDATSSATGIPQRTWNTTSAARLAVDGNQSIHQRRNMAESVSELGIDSEWEKIENE